MTRLHQIKALAWSFFDTFGVYVIRFGFVVVIARILEPKDYGLIGMAAIFIAMASLISEGGLAMALIQKKNANQNDYSTVFFFNLGVSIILYGSLFLLSGIIAAFFTEPLLKEIIRVSSLGIVLSALITVQVTILNKRLDFKKQAFIQMFSAIISGTIGLYFAYNGFGVWTLVYKSLTGTSVSVLMFWFLSKWMPSFAFSISSFRELFGYGINIFLQGFTSIIFDKFYYPLLGKLYDATQLGFFSKADNFYQVFIRRITIAYGRVAFPAFSLIQDNPTRFNNSYKKTIAILAFILIPLNIFLILTIEPLLLLLLTEKWANSIPYIQLLYLDGFFFPFMLLNQNVLNAIGKSRLSLAIDMVKKLFLLIGVVFTFRIGIQALILAQVSSSLIGLMFSGWLIRKNLLPHRFLLSLLPVVAISIVCFAISYYLSTHIDNQLYIIAVHSLFFGTYLMVNKIFKTTPYLYFLEYLKPAFSRMNKKV